LTGRREFRSRVIKLHAKRSPSCIEATDIRRIAVVFRIQFMWNLVQRGVQAGVQRAILTKSSISKSLDKDSARCTKKIFPRAEIFSADVFKCRLAVFRYSRLLLDQ